MSGTRTHRLMLWSAATDRTFRRVEETLVGKCIHCRRRLAVSLRGTPVSAATLEHILPRHHGGTDDLHNLAVACKSCNNLKGSRHDHRSADDPGLKRVVEGLLARRRERWREPLAGLVLPPLHSAPEPEASLPSPAEAPPSRPSRRGRGRGRRRRRRG
ncbi:MAG: HNH endonuclease [Myxococcota bacterium]